MWWFDKHILWNDKVYYIFKNHCVESTEMAKKQKRQTIMIYENMEKTEPSYTASGIIKWCTLENSLAIP